MKYVSLSLSLCALLSCAEHPDKARFAEREAILTSQGKLRVEQRPADAPFDSTALAANFVRIAFFESPDDRVAVPRALSRWELPIRYTLIGASAEESDIGEVDDLMRRIASLTGLPVVKDGVEPNFMILLLDDRERRAFSDKLASVRGEDAARAFDAMASYGLDCSVHAFSDVDRPNRITSAIVYVRAEVTGLYRKSCLHEEIVQGLGLFNDDSTVRPSIFNDDEEFALLTEHDQYLVRILYDRRLAPGMTAERALTTVNAIARELLAE